MIRPDLIGPVPHFPVVNHTSVKTPIFGTWKSLHFPFASEVLGVGEYQEGVYSYSMDLPVDTTMPNLKMYACHHRIPMIPDDSRPGYPFILSVDCQYRAAIDASKATPQVDFFAGFSHNGGDDDIIRSAAYLPCHHMSESSPHNALTGHGLSTFTMALPPAVEQQKGWYACIGMAFRTRSGAATLWSCEAQMSVNVLYRNRPVFDPSMA